MTMNSLLSARALPLASAIAAGAIALLARIEVPFVPVPFTLLTFAAMLAGLALGSRGGAAAATLWIVAGAAGIPVFASGKLGMAAILGPTGGYILALPLIPVGWSALRGGLSMRAIGLAAAASVGHLAIGALWLAAFVGGRAAFLAGFAPFVLAEAAKGATALAISRIRRTA